MITKIALCLTLSTFFSHAAERTHYIPPATITENTTDLFDDIINQWNYAAVANTVQPNDESNTSVSNNTPPPSFSEFCCSLKRIIRLLDGAKIRNL